MRARHENVQILLDEIERQGGTDSRVVRTKKHRQIVFTFEGREMAYTVGSTPSDYRARRRALTELRRLKRPRTVDHRPQKQGAIYKPVRPDGKAVTDADLEAIENCPACSPVGKTRITDQRRTS